MSDGVSGRRDSQSDEWSWTARDSQEEPGRRPPWLPILAILAGVILVVGGVAVFLLTGDRSESNGAAFNPTPAEEVTETAGAAGESPEASPTPNDAPGVTIQLLAWSREQSRWLADRLDDAESYREGESVPFLLLLEGVQGGTSYGVAVRYQCGGAEGAAFDFLAEAAEGDGPSLVESPGPGRVQGDTTIPIPDDPSTNFDDDVERRFMVWGAGFGAAPQGPSPTEECAGTKEFALNLTAQGSAVWLAFAGHLAAAADWGDGRGASSQQEPFFTEIAVDGSAPVRLEIAPEAIAAP